LGFLSAVGLDLALGPLFLDMTKLQAAVVFSHRSSCDLTVTRLSWR